MGLPFLSFMNGDIQTRLYAVITAQASTLGPAQTAGSPKVAPRAPSSTSSSPYRWHSS